MAEKSISIDKAWEILFDRHDIAKQVAARGSFRISSADINTVKEARLMAKFDQSTQLPAIFKENKLSILPISRGEYIIGGFETHAKIKYDSVRPTPVPVPNLQTIDYTNLYSESSALLFAYNSGIIADILGGEAVFTVNGRMSSGSFSYWVRNNRLPAGEQHLDVVNAQVEIDAGYESRDALMLCEAKNVAVDELLIRQLYYPYRLWSSKISKPILPVFLVYSNDVFHAFIYRFFDREFYNSLELVEHKAYTFADEDIHLKDVVDIWNSIQCTEEPPITFPQADTFSRIVDILSVLYEKTMTPEEVTLKYDFDARQTSYYISACEYLGLLYRDTNEYGEPGGQKHHGAAVQAEISGSHPQDARAAGVPQGVRRGAALLRRAGESRYLQNHGGGGFAHQRHHHHAPLLHGAGMARVDFQPAVSGGSAGAASDIKVRPPVVPAAFSVIDRCRARW